MAVHPVAVWLVLEPAGNSLLGARLHALVDVRSNGRYREGQHGQVVTKSGRGHEVGHCVRRQDEIGQRPVHRCLGTGRGVGALCRVVKPQGFFNDRTAGRPAEGADLGPEPAL